MKPSTWPGVYQWGRTIKVSEETRVFTFLPLLDDHNVVVALHLLGVLRGDIGACKARLAELERKYVGKPQGLQE